MATTEYLIRRCGPDRAISLQARHQAGRRHSIHPGVRARQSAEERARGDAAYEADVAATEGALRLQLILGLL